MNVFHMHSMAGRCRCRFVRAWSTGLLAGLTIAAVALASPTGVVAAEQPGRVVAWGANITGQLGDGSSGGQRSRPLVIRSLRDVSVIDAGDDTSLAATSAGSAWAWGWNRDGQLGTGDTYDRHSPAAMPGLTDVIAIAAGSYHSLALKADGTVWAMGANYYGQLGDGSGTAHATPVQVPGLSDVTAIAAGFDHSLAVRSDGTVWAWGRNAFGQLGDGTTTDRSTPVQVSGLTDVVAIDGYQHSVAVRSDGTVWAWGRNAFGQLGEGTTTDRSTPVQVSGLTDVTEVEVGDYHTLALRTDGTVWAWGYNSDGRLGDGTFIQRSVPVQVTGLTDVVTAIAAGSWHSLALLADGTMMGWGNNSYGQLGTDVGSTPIAMTIAGLRGITAIAAGGAHSLAVTTAAAPATPMLTIENNRAFQPETTIPVQWNSDENDVAFDVRYRSVAAGPWTDFGPFVSWQTATTDRSGMLQGRPGRTYCFSGRASYIGLPSSWTPERCTAIRLDDRAFNRGEGFRQRTGAAYYQNTYLSSTKARAKTWAGGSYGYLASKVDVLVSKGPGFGTISVSFGGEHKRINLDAPTRRDQIPVSVANLAKPSRNVVVIRVISSAKPVIIDGVGISRR